MKTTAISSNIFLIGHSSNIISLKRTVYKQHQYIRISHRSTNQNHILLLHYYADIESYVTHKEDKKKKKQRKGLRWRTPLSQENIPVETHSLHLLASSLIDQLRKMGPHADVDCLLHLRWQGSQFLVVLLQGLLIELCTQKPAVRQRLQAC